METGTFSEQDAMTFATRLGELSTTLTPGEQAVLALVEQQLATRLTSDDDDVTGYMIDLNAVAQIRQREMLDEADQQRPAARLDAGQVSDPAGDRARLWQRIAIALGRQASAMSPRTTRTTATG